MKKLITICFAALLILGFLKVDAQEVGYLSLESQDGQYYHSLLLEGETAEFKTTFYAGEQYRIVACSKDGLGNVNLKVLDANYNLIFNNSDYDGYEALEFKFGSTNDYYIQAIVPGSGSGCQ